VMRAVRGMASALWKSAAAAAPHTAGRSPQKPGLLSSYKAWRPAIVCPCGAHLQGPLSRRHPINVCRGKAHVFRPRRWRPKPMRCRWRRASAHCLRKWSRGMGVEARPAARCQFADQGEIAVRAAENRIDQQALAEWLTSAR